MIFNNYTLVGEIFYYACTACHLILCLGLFYECCRLEKQYLKGEADLRLVYLTQFKVFYLVTICEIFYYVTTGYGNDLFVLSLKLMPIVAAVCYIQCRFFGVSILYISRLQKYLINAIINILFWACIFSSGFYLIKNEPSLFEATTHFERISSIVNAVTTNNFGRDYVRYMLGVSPLALNLLTLLIDIKEKRSPKTKTFSSLMVFSSILALYFLLQDILRVSVMSRTLEIFMIFLTFNIPAVCFLVESHSIAYYANIKPEEVMVRKIYKIIRSEKVSNSVKKSQVAIAKKMVKENSDIYSNIQSRKLRNFLKLLVETN